MKATIHLCTYKTNSKGGKILSTRWSCWDSREFKSKDEARTFAHGVVCGLSFKWKRAAVALTFSDGTEECFTD